VKQQLFEEGYRFDFFQAVRLLDRISRGREPVGRDGPPALEVARFRTRVSLDFPASEVHEITLPEREGDPPRMTIAFLGMTGPLGLLPHCYTELLLDRTRYRDNAFRDFLDLFHHRVISLFYRAWEKYRFPIAYERSGQDAFTEYLFDLIGMGTQGLRGRLALPDQGLLLYAGLIAQRPHSSSAVESILRDYFGVPARIEQFFGQWLPLDAEYRTHVGTANSELGANMVCGERIWNVQSKFRVRLGPLSLRQFRAFLPPGASFAPLTDLARFLVGAEFDFDVQLVLKADDVPDCQLETGKDTPPMLGWTTWLKTKDLTRDASEVVLAVPN
jgi:type VI secretion system protein ImpH